MTGDRINFRINRRFAGSPVALLAAPLIHARPAFGDELDGHLFHMTSNQTRAVFLAGEIDRGRLVADDLSEHDWVLLVLAAGLSCSAVPAAVVTGRVLENACAKAGYFGPRGSGQPVAAQSHA